MRMVSLPLPSRLAEAGGDFLDRALIVQMFAELCQTAVTRGYPGTPQRETPVAINACSSAAATCNFAAISASD
ncbi:MAG: hypothetical protein WAR81_02420, partial [Pseudomonadales bacterium]